MEMLRNYLFLLLIVFTGCERMQQDAHAGHQEQMTYTCPMHPELTRNAPGQCPVCGMDLVAKPKGGEFTDDTSLAMLLKPVNTYVLSGVQTIKPVAMKVPVTIIAQGTIGYDTRERKTVSARASGRIETLFVKSPFQFVTKGQKLFEFYSPELVTEQENLIYLLDHDPSNTSIILAIEKKLELLGMSAEQIAEIKKKKMADSSVSVFSSYSGHIHDAGSEANAGLGGMYGKSPGQGNRSVKEGMYLQKGQAIFTIYDTKNVWALMNVLPENRHLLKIGQTIKILVDENEIQGEVDFIEPVMRPDQDFFTVRAYLENLQYKLKPGAILEATITGDSIQGLFVPATSIISLGQNKIAFIKEAALFRAHQVSTGIRQAGLMEIVSGISNSDSIARNAQFLLDSESFAKVTALE